MNKNKLLGLGIATLLALLLVGGVFADSDVQGTKKIIVYEKKPEECINPTGYKITLKATNQRPFEMVDVKITDDEKCIEKIIKYYTNENDRKAEKTKYISQKSLDKEKSLSVGTDKAVLVSGSKTCISDSKYTDVIYVTLTELKTHHTFTYDGTYITSESGYAETYCLNDGWHVTSGPTFDFGPNPLPATSDYSIGQAYFAWLFNTWPHSHKNRINVYGNGNADATFTLTGDKVPGGHWVTSLECS